MFYLEIANLTAAPIDGELFQKAAEKVFKKLALTGDFEISLAVIGEAKMRNLNKFWRGKNRVTDVLSFSFQEDFSPKAEEKEKLAEARDENGNILGEIFICLPYGKKEAKRQNIPLEKELETLFVHGALHLLGYDHERSEKEEKEFFELQKKMLN